MMREKKRKSILLSIGVLVSYLLGWLVLLFRSSRGQATGRWLVIGSVLAVTIGGSVIVYQAPGDKQDLCDSSGVWQPTGFTVQIDDGSTVSEYACPTRLDTAKKPAVRLCSRLSGTGRTCYPALNRVEGVFLFDVYRTFNVTTERVENVFEVNETCIFVPANPSNGTREHFVPCDQLVEQIVHIDVVERSEYSHQEVYTDNVLLNVTELGFWCYQDSTTVVCKSLYDGDGWLKRQGLKEGISYFVIDKQQRAVNEDTGHRSLHKTDEKVFR